MRRDSSIRVGFALTPNDWLGGRNYLRNLLAALRTLPGNPIIPVLIAGKQTEDASEDFPGIEIVRTSILDRKSVGWFVRKVIAKTTSQDMVLQKLLQRHGISVISHSFHLGFDLGRQSAIKNIGWIPDLQHVHMPEFFSSEDRHRRDQEFSKQCMRCDTIIASSECARVDLCAFSPENAYKMELLRFVANPTPFTDVASLPDLQRLYSFEGTYFLVPNQFWAHKNHRIVIGALQELKRQGKPFLVLMTGKTVDHRDPLFFPSLMQYAADCDVLDCFRVLGQIPFNHLAGLMRHTVAFINPSRFEGWSTSVEEAKSLGKQIVLSDLPVHREQAPEHGFYFPPEDPVALAAAMRAAHDGFDEQCDRVMQNVAREKFPERQRDFGETYRCIVERALEGRSAY